MDGDGGHKTIHWANGTVFFQRVLENYHKTEVQDRTIFPLAALDKVLHGDALPQGPTTYP